MLAAVISALFAAGLGFAGPASAYASLLFTTPSAGTAVPQSPTAITLVFDEHVTITAHAVRLASPTDKPVTLGAPSVKTGDGRLFKGGSTLTVAVVHPLAAGTYTVDWQVISDDGDYVAGSYQFAVGSAASGSLSSGTGTSTTGLLVGPTLARWIQFLALALLLGEAALRRTLHRRHIYPAVSPRSWTRWAALAGLIASLLLVVLLAGNGSLVGGFTHPSSAALTSRPGVIVLVEVAAFAVALVVSSRWKRFAWLPVTAVIGAEAVRAHPADYAGSVGTVITAVHLAVAAVLIGALSQALRHLLHGKRDGRRDGRIILAYSGIALWLFVAVVASGTLASLIIVPLHALTSTRYGLTLLVKLALVLAVAGMRCAAVAGCTAPSFPNRPVCGRRLVLSSRSCS